MARSCKFSIIRARPDRIRDEWVNVGLVVERENGFDIRIPEVRKLTPLTGHHWDTVADAFAGVMKQSFESVQTITELVKLPEMQSDVFVAGPSGELLCRNEKEYEDAVALVLEQYVSKPKLTRSQRQDKINSEISKVLKNAGVLSKKGETINDGKVIKQFLISEEKEFVADFAYKTNRLKIVSTLELRGAKSAHAKACEKGSVLYFAKEKFGKDMLPIGVYAVDPQEADNHRSEIEILRSFADGKVFNWMDANERRDFNHTLYLK